MKDYPAVPITPFTHLIKDKDGFSDLTPAWPGFSAYGASDQAVRLSTLCR